jgi:hypothetical protein
MPPFTRWFFAESLTVYRFELGFVSRFIVVFDVYYLATVFGRFSVILRGVILPCSQELTLLLEVIFN